MAGGMVAYASLHRPNLLRPFPLGQSILGFAMIFAGLVLITRTSQFPGYWAILPTLGACLIISSGSNSWLNQRLLANRPMIWVGKISYPLYLWHWPLLSFLYISLGVVPREGRAAAVLASVLLAWLTYQFAEKPLRFGGAPRRKAAALLAGSFLLAPAAGIAGIGYTWIAVQGIVCVYVLFAMRSSTSS